MKRVQYTKEYVMPLWLAKALLWVTRPLNEVLWRAAQVVTEDRLEKQFGPDWRNY